MAHGKKGFILYADLISTVERLPKEKAGELFLTILEYVNDRNPEPEDILIQIAFEPVKQQLKRDLRVWEEARQHRSESGRLGGIKSGEARRSKTKQNEAPLQIAKQNEANEAVIVNVNVNDNVTDIEKEKRKRFTPPARDEVFSLMAVIDPRHAPAEADNFIDYYSANGWKVGRHSMKDWKAAARKWIRNTNTFKNGSEKLGTSAARIQAAADF